MRATGLNNLERAIIQTVTYVDGFDYPLTAGEIHRYLPHYPATFSEVNTTLQRSSRLVEMLHQSSGYYMLPERAGLVDVRRARLLRATSVWPEAIAFGAHLARLPFVRMVAVTGSLAVDNITEPYDIDFMIVTEQDHVWLCRAFAIALVRLAGLRGIDLCPNYFVSETALSISERNLYTAHELAQMVPLHGLELYTELRRQNAWTLEFLPNATGTPDPAGLQAVAPQQVGAAWRRAQWASEALLRSPAGRWLERWEMERKIEKFRQQDQSEESVFTASCCKGHFHNHQSRAIDSYESRLAQESI